MRINTYQYLKKGLRFLSLLTGSLILASCATTQTTSKVSFDKTIPTTWKNTTESPTDLDPEIIAQWWKRFNDPTLNVLILDSLENNRDMRTAILAIQQVRLRKNLSRAERLPSLSGSLSATGSRTDDLENNTNNSSDHYSASLSASWELDIFGKQKAAIDAAKAELNATIEDYYGLQVSLAAEVASSYFSLRSLESEYKITLETLGIREETLLITRWQAEAGQVNDLEVQQSIVSLEQAKASIPSLEQSIEESRNALALLCRKRPGALTEILKQSASIPVVPDSLAVGIPMQALAQRPDIRADELRIEVAIAKLSEAQKKRLPTLSLSGSIGLDEAEPFDLLNPQELVSRLASNLSAPIWDAGKIKLNIEIQDIALQQAYLNYENTVLTALGEVENALSAIQKRKTQLTLILSATRAARISMDLAHLQYEAGEEDLLTVLDAQRTLLNLEQSLITTRVKELVAYTELYKSLGGGWSPSKFI